MTWEKQANGLPGDLNLILYLMQKAALRLVRCLRYSFSMQSYALRYTFMLL